MYIKKTILPCNIVIFLNQYLQGENLLHITCE